MYLITEQYYKFFFPFLVHRVKKKCHHHNSSSTLAYLAGFHGEMHRAVHFHIDFANCVCENFCMKPLTFLHLLFSVSIFLKKIYRKCDVTICKRNVYNILKLTCLPKARAALENLLLILPHVD